MIKKVITGIIFQYNVMIDGRNSFDQLVKNNLRTYVNIGKTITNQVDNYRTGCLLDYPYFNKYFQLLQQN